MRPASTGRGDGARRTKIVATIGPRTDRPEPLRQLLEAGADVVRLNFAHGTFERHRATARLVRETASELGRVVGLLVDLPGPKMRTGPLAAEEVELHAGRAFTLTTRMVQGDGSVVSTNVPDLPELVSVGRQIFLADGRIILTTTGVSADAVDTEVVRGGVLRSKKGMHLPGAEGRIDPFTPGDRQALEVALDMGADLIGCSFVRHAGDIATISRALGSPHPLLVAKIETRAAVDNLLGIVEVADAVMVARGDLGIQIPLEDVPLVQKRIIGACNHAGKPAITATQMLESMTRAPLPTRAEVADVANAVLDGTDAVMLSEETAVGEHPVETVRTMSRIARSTEASHQTHVSPEDHLERPDPVSWAVAEAAVATASHVGAGAIVCPTRTGATPRRVASFRPRARIVALCYDVAAMGALALAWGVTPFPLREAFPDDVDDQVASVIAAAKSAGLVGPGELAVVVAGGPGRPAGSTDSLRVVEIA